MNNQFIIENNENSLITVVIEPWCYEYYLKKNDILILKQPNELEGYYHQIVEPYNNGILITLYVEGKYNEPLVYLNDCHVEAFDDSRLKKT